MLLSNNNKRYIVYKKQVPGWWADKGFGGWRLDVGMHPYVRYVPTSNFPPPTSKYLGSNYMYVILSKTKYNILVIGNDE